MSKVLLMYHSGSGSTKKISEMFQSKLGEFHEIEMENISSDFDYSRLPDYDFIMLGFPTYYWEPSVSISEFVSKMPVYERPLRVFVFTTCGTYVGNSLRILIKKLFSKNIITVGWKKIKGPASDYFVFPIAVSSMFEYEGNISKKIENVVKEINELIKNNKIPYKVPLFKWYVPANNILKYAGKKWFNYYKDRLQIVDDRCLNCNLCSNSCQRSCWEAGSDFPKHSRQNCEFCLKCVHHCPQNAIIFSEKMKEKPRFNKHFYSDAVKKNTKAGEIT